MSTEVNHSLAHTVFSSIRYLGNALVNFWTVGLVEYFSWVRIVFTGGYVIVHEDHYVLIL